MTDTIFALASAYGRSGVAVIRVSGPLALQSLTRFSGLDEAEIKPRYATMAILKDDVSRETIDSGLVIYFRAPHSYTGEEVVEYHTHGSEAVIQNLLEILGRQDGHRLAEPGEFTRRAFENGKMDLTEAEAVADLIDAQTRLQKDQALHQMGGALRRLYEGWAERLIRSLAHIEADIEFPDEEDADGVGALVQSVIDSVRIEMRAHVSDRRGEVLRAGVQVAIIGPPNAGKSSLMNALVQREVAIVSDMPGTTRDVLSAQLDLEGCPVTLYDTAGLRPDKMGADGHDAIEAEGMRRAAKIAGEADLKILLFDGAAVEPDAHTLSYLDENSIVVASKADANPVFSYPAPYLSVSSKREGGLDALLKRLGAEAKKRAGVQNAPVLTRDRHRRHIHQALEALERSARATLPELMAEDVRLAVREVGRVTGKVDVEDLLDIVFRDFCIGK